MQILKTYLLKRLRNRQAETSYNELCHQARETTYVCTYYRYEGISPEADYFLDDSSFFDASKLPQKRSAILFGSGPSALSIDKDKIARLKEEYLIVGFNFACLLNIPFDLFFFEAFGLNSFGDQLLDAMHLLASEGTSVVFKSVWMHKYPSLKGLADLSRHNNFTLLRSYKLPSLQHEWITTKKAPSIYLKSLFRPHHLEAGYHKEAFSTMLTIMPVLANAGIENIHLIGCDMTHDYFFRSPEYVVQESKKLMIPNEYDIPRTYNNVHATGSHPLENIITMLPLVNTLGLANVTVDFSVQGPLAMRLPRKTL